MNPDDQKKIADEILGLKPGENIVTCQAYLQAYLRAITQHLLNQALDPPAPGFTTLRSAADIIGLASMVQNNLDASRYDIWEKSNQNTTIRYAKRDVDSALRVAVQARLMIDCDEKDHFSQSYEVDGFGPLKWEDEERFVDFVTNAFPLGADPDMMKDMQAVLRQKEDLMAWRLGKKTRIRFRPTDQISNHLLYDPSDHAVYVFHHVTFLKSCLLLTKDEPFDMEFSDSLKVGSLPPQLLLETLRTLQDILFPIGDRSSARFLQELIRSKDTQFDPACAVPIGPIRPAPQQFEYKYWNKRLIILHQLAREPPPRGRVERWLQEHASERNALYIAIVGLFLSALFGFLGLVVGIVQAWISYRAWKDSLL